ncbi:MAG: LamG domain-containing protein, partial [Oscillospiraceae bacterium]|nr:LamG domain-containing protein [Oscillospiraceae bacterium]
MKKKSGGNIISVLLAFLMVFPLLAGMMPTVLAVPGDDSVYFDVDFTDVDGKTVYENSSFGHVGTLFGNAKVEYSDIFGKEVLDTDGWGINGTATGSYLHFPYNENLRLKNTKALGMEMVLMFRSDNTKHGGNMNPFGKNDASDYEIVTTNNTLRVSVYIDGAYRYVDYRYEVGKVYYVAGSYDGQYVYMYVNGEEVGRTPATGDIVLSSNTALAIGANPERLVNVTAFFDGLVDSLKLRNEPLTAKEVADKYAELSQRIDFSKVHF